MPVMQQGDLEIAYEVIGEGQPWVLTPGGRFSKDYGGVREMAEALAERGKKVLIYDRLNCGASAVSFTDGPSAMRTRSRARPLMSCKTSSQSRKASLAKISPRVP